MAESGSGREAITASLYGFSSADPDNESFDAVTLSPEDISQIGRLMRALADLRETEQEILDASEKYMKLSRQDMRALHYLIVANRLGEIVTPSMIATHLKISPASTTKLLNRLERGGHIARHMHPMDRRAFAIEVTPATEASARQTVGRQHAKRVHAAARLSGEERETVIRFLRDMAQEISISNADWAQDH
ncbi:MAG TPA: MarR family transcriptional regulator [Arachnia sp.]|nr:MarR family transcriptional regulator [Arachnia sp.]HMT86292.1 MarR family transcriptional regulator [Arachnia sp.]